MKDGSNSFIVQLTNSRQLRKRHVLFVQRHITATIPSLLTSRCSAFRILLRVRLQPQSWLRIEFPCLFSETIRWICHLLTPMTASITVGSVPSLVAQRTGSWMSFAAAVWFRVDPLRVRGAERKVSLNYPRKSACSNFSENRNHDDGCPYSSRTVWMWDNSPRHS